MSQYNLTEQFQNVEKLSRRLSPAPAKYTTVDTIEKTPLECRFTLLSIPELCALLSCGQKDYALLAAAELVRRYNKSDNIDELEQSIYLEGGISTACDLLTSTTDSNEKDLMESNEFSTNNRLRNELLKFVISTASVEQGRLDLACAGVVRALSTLLACLANGTAPNASTLAQTRLALWAIYNLSANATIVSALCLQGIIPSLLQLLTWDDDDIPTTALLILGILSSNDMSHPIIRQHDGMVVLTKVLLLDLKQRNTRRLLLALYTTANILISEDCVVAMLSAQGAKVLAVLLANTSDPDLLLLLLTALTNMTMFDTARQALRELSLIPSLVAMLSCDNLTIVVQTLCVLINLCCDQSNVYEIFNHGALSQVILMVSTPHVDLQSCCMRLIVAMSKCAPLKQALIHSECLSILTLLLQVPNVLKETQVSVLTAMTQLATGDSECIGSLLSRGVCVALHPLVRSPSEQLQQHSIELLAVLVEDDRTTEAIAEQLPIVSGILDIASTTRNSSTKKAAVVVLKRLVHNEKIREYVVSTGKLPTVSKQQPHQPSSTVSPHSPRSSNAVRTQTEVDVQSPRSESATLCPVYGQHVVLKLSLNGDVRMVRLPRSKLRLDGLTAAVAGKYHIDSHVLGAMRYKDHAGDMVLLETDDDLELALELYDVGRATNPAFRLEVQCSVREEPGVTPINTTPRVPPIPTDHQPAFAKRNTGPTASVDRSALFDEIRNCKRQLRRVAHDENSKQRSAVRKTAADNSLAETLMAALNKRRVAVQDTHVEEEGDDGSFVFEVQRKTTSPMSAHHVHFDVHDDTRRLKKAVKGLGTDEATIIEILANRSKAQIAEIAAVYEREYHVSLKKDLEDDTSGNFRRLLSAIVTPVAEYKAHYLHHAMTGVGTNERALIDVFTQVSNRELNDIKYYYELHYGDGKGKKDPNPASLHKPVGHSKLEHDISNETSFNFRKTLLALADANRQEFAPGTGIDHGTVVRDTEALFKAGEAKFGTDDSTFIEILTTRSPWHLHEVDKEYRRRYGHALHDAIRRETSGDYMEALLALVTLPEQYWARRVHDAVAGAGTNDSLLVFIFGTFDKPTLQWFALAYKELYGRSMEHDVAADTSGDYKKLLMALLK